MKTRCNAVTGAASHQPVALANAALKYRFGEDHQPVTVSQLLTSRRREDYSDDLWTVYQRVQENLMKGVVRTNRTGEKQSHPCCYRY
jgi:hypothetical protein